MDRRFKRLPSGFGVAQMWYHVGLIPSPPQPSGSSQPSATPSCVVAAQLADRPHTDPEYTVYTDPEYTVYSQPSHGTGLELRHA